MSTVLATPRPVVRRRSRLAVAGLLVGTVCLLSALFFDRQLATLAHAIPRPYRDWFALIGSLGNAVWYIVPAALGYLLVRWARSSGKWPERAEALHRWQQRSLFLLANVIASGLFADLIKVLCGRPRPKVFFGDHLYSFSFFEFSVKMWSFPSGHATTVFAAMTTASFLMPRGRWLWFPLATVVAVCRVLGGAHFPSDVLAGAFIGVASSLLLRDYFQNRRLLDFPATVAAPGRFKRHA